MVVVSIALSRLSYFCHTTELSVVPRLSSGFADHPKTLSHKEIDQPEDYKLGSCKALHLPTLEVGVDCRERVISRSCRFIPFHVYNLILEEHRLPKVLRSRKVAPGTGIVGLT